MESHDQIGHPIFDLYNQIDDTVHTAATTWAESVPRTCVSGGLGKTVATGPFADQYLGYYDHEYHQQIYPEGDLRNINIIAR